MATPVGYARVIGRRKVRGLGGRYYSFLTLETIVPDNSTPAETAEVLHDLKKIVTGEKGDEDKLHLKGSGKFSSVLGDNSDGKGVVLNRQVIRKKGDEDKLQVKGSGKFSSVLGDNSDGKGVVLNRQVIRKKEDEDRKKGDKDTLHLKGTRKFSWVLGENQSYGQGDAKKSNLIGKGSFKEVRNQHVEGGIEKEETRKRGKCQTLVSGGKADALKESSQENKHVEDYGRGKGRVAGKCGGSELWKRGKRVESLFSDGECGGSELWKRGKRVESLFSDGKGSRARRGDEGIGMIGKVAKPSKGGFELTKETRKRGRRVGLSSSSSSSDKPLKNLAETEELLEHRGNKGKFDIDESDPSDELDPATLGYNC